ncbi:hypothetical protein Lesp02_25970 [Lentzea sp. NBRC 105346]|uniref:CHRD domain-containing protein n=1 Tax=Lentzea sp. NBRC 105346 TaxID=3032205 RepID=UPI0025569551|nr:CHRD domain-containing protein [Lentzea sp. NBRC 105346]GLZ30408.1 hypothetical protein Lesp02_25970 [Lentzea sp. NBRC 105346]
MSVRKSVLSGIVLGVALASAGGAIASAHPGHSEPAPAAPGEKKNVKVDTTGQATYLVADLNGKNEVSNDGKQNVGDQDGKARQIVRIQGNQVAFAIQWNGIAAPTAAHIHEGVTGKNGAVKVPFFAAALPASLNAVKGSVTVEDKALLDSLKKNPGNFYANLHTSEFAAGAVRAQFRKVDSADLNDVLNNGGNRFFSFGTGNQEIAADPAKPVGDKDGFSIFGLKVSNDRINFTIRWNNVAAPTNGHLHKGGIGVNGPVVADLFAAPAGLPVSINAVAGSVTAPAAVTAELKKNPFGHYSNLHTTEFSGGAVRGQVFRIG